MKCILRLVLVLCALALTASPVAAKDKWINLRTKNFNIASNADEGDTRQLALKLEQFRSVISKLTNTSTIAPVPITVVVFKSDGSFKPFKPLYKGKPSNLSGFFQQSEDENLIALDISANEEHPMALIFHEYTHLFTAYATSPWPLWLKEGLAEFYSTFDVKKTEVTIGKPLSRHVLLLRENKFVPFQTLFSVGHNSPVYNERDKQGIFYAESWALAHYLMFGNHHARQPQLVQFLLLLSRGENVERAFTEAFKIDFAGMEKELRRYIGNDSYPGMIYTLKSTEGDKEVSVRTMSDGEAQYHLGNLLMRINRLDDAETYFNQAAALDPGLAGPYEGRGFIAMRRNKFSEAKDHFRQAAALGSQNHLVHYYYAETIERDLKGERASISIISADLAKTMIDELKTSIKLMPGFAPAYDLLGFVYLVAGGDLSEGARLMKTAIELEPQNKRFALTLAELQLRMQDYAGAKKTLDPLLEGDDETGVKAQAQSIVNMIERYTRGAAAAEPPTESTGRPRLNRKADESIAREETDPGDKRGPAGSSGRPAIRLEGAQTIGGTLAAIECSGGSGMVLVLKTNDKLLRFNVSDAAKLQFFTQDPQFRPDVKCGPINLAAFIYYKPTTSGKPHFAGEAVAVEFRK